MTDRMEHDVELTVSALKEGPVALGISGGLVELGRWEERLAAADAPALREIGAALAELRGELSSDGPDAAVLADLLRRLGNRTLAVAAEQPAGELRSRLTEPGHLLRQGAAEGP